MDGFKQLLDRVGERLGRFSFNQKVLLGALLSAAVISVVIFSFWLRHEEKTVLFTNLAPEDASLALAELNKQDIDADLTNGGTTILVPESVVHRLRVDLAAKGIPSSGKVGFEIFDGKQYGLTEFLQNVNFKRALEGELTKSIESLAGIHSARVHLVLPKPSIFKKLQSEPTASVVVRMGRNSQLGEMKIVGIQSLVAGSVEGLVPANVTVIDQHGSVLSARHEPGFVGRSESQLALKREVEEYLRTKAESMLGQVLGDGRSIVRVDADLDFEQIDTEREIFDPEATVVRSEEVDEASDPETGGTQESSVTNYEINRTIERIVGETGGIETLSVAVFVDGTYTESPEDEGLVYTPRGEEELVQIERVVRTAVGMDVNRGDRIEVVNMQFSDRGEEYPLPGAGPGWLELVSQYGGKLALFAVAVALALGLKRNLSRLVAEGFPAAGGGGRKVAAGADTGPVLEMGSENAEARMAEEVKEFAAENPEKVAEVLKTWIGESD
jgi:flagellar M-ring protein FliF